MKCPTCNHEFQLLFELERITNCYSSDSHQHRVLCEARREIQRLREAQAEREQPAVAKPQVWARSPGHIITLQSVSHGELMNELDRRLRPR